MKICHHTIYSIKGKVFRLLLITAVLSLNLLEANEIERFNKMQFNKLSGRIASLQITHPQLSSSFHVVSKEIVYSGLSV